MSTSAANLDSPPVGKRVPIAGRQYFVDRAGAGDPAVVFLPGAGAFALDYWNVHVRAARLTTSVLYDRAGTGWSDPGELPVTLSEVTDELRRVLAAIGIEPPFIFVGHSLGGGYARRFAQRFPAEVAGLLLLDPLHEDAERYFPARVMEMSRAMKGQPIPELPAEVIEAYRPIFQAKLADWPAPIRDAVIAKHLAAWRTGMVEASNVDTLYEELRQGGPLPDVPVIVMTAMAVDPAQRGFMAEEDLAGINEGKRIMNQSLVASVERGDHRDLPNAAHAWMHLEEPDAVVAALTELVAAARKA